MLDEAYLSGRIQPQPLRAPIGVRLSPKSYPVDKSNNVLFVLQRLDLAGILDAVQMSLSPLRGFSIRSDDFGSAYKLLVWHFVDTILIQQRERRFEIVRIESGSETFSGVIHGRGFFG